MATLEKEIEGALVAMIKRKGGLCLKWVCPGWSGVPDRICLLPGARVIFVETKRPKGGKVRALQRYWARQLAALGFEHYFIFNNDDIYALRERIEGAE
jgi:hypothetical protein